jgi:WD40 repeat protein
MPIRAEYAASFQLIHESQNHGRVFQDHYSRALSPDTRMLAVAGCAVDENLNCSNEPAFELLDVDSGKVVRQLDSLAPVIQQLAFSPDGAYLAAAGCHLPLYLVGVPDTNCNKPKVWVVDLATGKIRAEMKGFHSLVTSLVWSPDGSRLYTGVLYATAPFDNVDNEISIFETSTGGRLNIIQPKTTNCSEMHLDLTPDGHYLVMEHWGNCGHPSFVQWWDVQNPNRPQSIQIEQPAKNHYLNTDGSLLLTRNDLDNTLKLFDMASGKLIHTYPHVLREFLFSDAHFLDNGRVMLATSDGKLEVLTLDSGEISILQPAQGNIYRYILSLDGKTLLTSGSGEHGGQLINHDSSLWNTETWAEAPFTSFIGDDPGDCGRPSAFSPDQLRYVCVDPYGANILVWGMSPSGEAEAEDRLLAYLADLAGGRYKEATNRLSMQESPADYRSPYALSALATLVPEADATDAASILATLCGDPDFPCLPVKVIVYRAQLADGRFLFAVTYAKPDGNQATWPPCEKAPESEYCDRRDGAFEYVVERQTEGGFKVVNGMPPSIYLRRGGQQ